MIRRLFAALADRDSSLRRAIAPTAAFLAVAIGVQYLQSTADNESRMLSDRRTENESLKQAFDEAYGVFLAMRKAIDHPSDADAQSAVPPADTLEQLSNALVPVDEVAGDVFPDTTPTAS